MDNHKKRPKERPPVASRRPRSEAAARTPRACVQPAGGCPSETVQAEAMVEIRTQATQAASDPGPGSGLEQNLLARNPTAGAKILMWRPYPERRHEQMVRAPRSEQYERFNLYHFPQRPNGS